MTTYRMYFLSLTGIIQGRDDFEAQGDECAIAIAETLRAACSDIAESFEVWQGTRRLDTSCPQRRQSTEHVALQTQETVLQREMAIRDSSWVIAKSQRLLEQTRRWSAREAQPDQG